MRLIAVSAPVLFPAQLYALAPDQVFDKVKDSIVVVKSMDAKGKVKEQGSGVLLDSGRVATNCHVVEGGTSYKVIQGTQVIPAFFYAGDSKNDICLLDAKGFSGKPAQIGTTKSLKVGAKVYAVGAPRGLELSLSDGIVSQLRGGPPPMIQTTAAISPGSSGGGLFDDEGRLIGLTTLYMKDGQNLNFAMPVEWLREVKPGRSNVVAGRNQVVSAPRQNQADVVPERSQTDWLRPALAFEKSEDWKKALDWCEKWVRSEPKNAMAWLRLGTAYQGVGRYNDAVNALRQAQRINPDIAETSSKLGAAYVKLNRYNEAVEAYRQALRIAPESAEIWGKLAAVYVRLNSYDYAVDACRQALRIDPKKGSIWALLGNSYTRLKRYNYAVDAYRQALRIDPAFVNAWGGLVVTYHEAGNQKAALDTVEELRRLDPQWAEELFNMIQTR
jgi:tetratricopeptide (TPR) repeat protein